MRITRTTSGQALAGIITAEHITAREVLGLERARTEFPAVIEALAAEECARPGCGHPHDGHGFHGGLSAFSRSSCAALLIENGGRACTCREFLHAERGRG